MATPAMNARRTRTRLTPLGTLHHHDFHTPFSLCLHALTPFRRARSKERQWKLSLPHSFLLVKVDGAVVEVDGRPLARGLELQVLRFRVDLLQVGFVVEV